MSEPSDRKIDQIDGKLISALYREPQSSNKRLAKLLGISEATVANRIESLIQDRVMRVTVQRDIRTAGYGVVGLVDIYVTGDSVSALAQSLGKIDQAISVSIMADDPRI